MSFARAIGYASSSVKHQAVRQPPRPLQGAMAAVDVKQNPHAEPRRGVPTAPAKVAPPAHVRFKLEITHDIKRSDLPFFERRGAHLVNLIQSDDFRLEYACWDVRGELAHLINYWDIGSDINVLFDTEIRLPDMPAYHAFDRLMVSETKNVVVSLAPDRVPIDQERAATGHVYLRVVTSVRSLDLAELSARIESDLVAFAARQRWMLGDTYLGLTGRANEIVQMWLIPDGAVRMAENRLSATSWHQLFGPTDYRVFERAPYDPRI